MSSNAVPHIDPEIITYRVKDASRVSGIGVTKLYLLMKEGRLERRKVGNMTLITAASLRSLLEGGEA